jgi:hypothetical protein
MSCAMRINWFSLINPCMSPVRQCAH